MSETGNFFQVDRTAFHAACGLGLNASVAYLFLACGTDGESRVSTWSTNAIEKYTGLGRGQAKKAIERLIAEGLVTQIYAGRGITARYQLVPAYASPAVTKGMKRAELDKLAGSEPEWIWLPNTLVTGAQGEIPPLERIRRCQDERVLKLLVELYHVQEIADRGGLPWTVIWQGFDRKQFTERGPWIIWQFTATEMTTVKAPFWHWFSTDLAGKRLAHKEANQAFWDAWKTIIRAGLIECVEHLVEGATDESAIIYPCPMLGTGTSAEQEVGQAAADAASNMLGELSLVSAAREAESGELFLPVDRAYPHVQMVGVYRLIYRPRTNMTAAWHARQFEYAKMAQGFRELAANALEGRPLQHRVA